MVNYSMDSLSLNAVTFTVLKGSVLSEQILIQSTMSTLITNTSLKLTPRVGPYLSLLFLVDPL